MSTIRYESSTGACLTLPVRGCLPAHLPPPQAAVKFRGDDAITNHPREVLQQEFASVEAVTKDSVVQALRSCSKAMNRVDAGATEGIHLEPWELLLSGAPPCCLLPAAAAAARAHESAAHEYSAAYRALPVWALQRRCSRTSGSTWGSTPARPTPPAPTTAPWWSARASRLSQTLAWSTTSPS